MRKYIYIVIFIFACLFPASATCGDEKAADPNRLFYGANALYERGEYGKAAEEYLKMADAGLEGGNLYYNAGNCFFKLGKIGYAILYYEKAKRYMPGDSDLRSNLEYARSFTRDGANPDRPRNVFTRVIGRPFRGVATGRIFVIMLIFYLTAIALGMLYMLRPSLMKKMHVLTFAVILGWVFSLTAFGARYYKEEVVRHGIIIQKEAECKYEPIEKSSSYYRVHEGEKVAVTAARNGWKRIRRADGKMGWIQKEAVEEI